MLHEKQKKNSNVEFFSLDKSILEWADECFKLATTERADCQCILEAEGYDIRKEALKLDNFYKEKVKKILGGN